MPQVLTLWLQTINIYDNYGNKYIAQALDRMPESESQLYDLAAM